MKKLSYTIFVAAHNNAVRLLGSAEKLCEVGDYPSAYALAYTAFEEVIKSQRAADVYTGFAEESDLRKIFSDHKEKQHWGEWIVADATAGLHDEDGNLIFIDPKIVSFKNRNRGLYVDFENGKVVEPKVAIARDMVDAMVRTVWGAIDQIMAKDFMGEQIGTKGFMK